MTASEHRARAEEIERIELRLEKIEPTLEYLTHLPERTFVRIHLSRPSRYRDEKNGNTAVIDVDYGNPLDFDHSYTSKKPEWDACDIQACLLHWFTTECEAPQTELARLTGEGKAEVAGEEEKPEPPTFTRAQVKEAWSAGLRDFGSPESKLSDDEAFMSTLSPSQQEGIRAAEKEREIASIQNAEDEGKWRHHSFDDGNVRGFIVKGPSFGEGIRRAEEEGQPAGRCGLCGGKLMRWTNLGGIVWILCESCSVRVPESWLRDEPKSPTPSVMGTGTDGEEDAA